MEKRYQVFVSSTYKDLLQERQEVIQALLELDCIPTAMEFFTAATEASWEVIRRILTACDYYVLVVAGRYGSVTPEGISYTEKEYELAVELGLPILVFPHADPDQLPKGKSERNPDLEEKLASFRSRIGIHTWKTWKSPQELGGHVSRAMVRALRVNPRPGWVRADNELAASQKVRLELARAQERIAELEAALRDRSPSNDYAHGEDKIELTFTLYGLDGLPWDITHVMMSWNEIFKTILPEVLELKDDSTIKHRLAFQICETTFPNVDAAHLSLQDDSWRKIVVQGHALQFWTRPASCLALTERGEDELRRLVAERRPRD